MSLSVRHGLCALSLLAAGTAQAAEVYVGAGIPGVQLGVALPLSKNFGLRADVMTLGSHESTKNEEGIDYAATLKTQRVGLFADWFPFSGSFRLTAGVTSNNYKLGLTAAGAGRTINIGDGTYVLGPSDSFNVGIEFPKSTPYVGIGFGHQLDTGLRFSFDLGAMVGKAKVTAFGTGTLAAQPDFQANVDKELAQINDGVGKVKAIPQLSVSLGYSF